MVPIRYVGSKRRILKYMYTSGLLHLRLAMTSGGVDVDSIFIELDSIFLEFDSIPVEFDSIFS